jgi:Glycosyl transferase family 2
VVPLVSCITTTYNYARYLPEAIDSALTQEYPSESIEVIVVDYGSTDDTPAVVEPYLGRVSYLRHDRNLGVIAAASDGIAAASGEFLAFLNADDRWTPQAVERLVSALLANPDAGLAYGDMRVIDAGGRTIHPSFLELMGVPPRRGRVLGSLMRSNFISSGSFAFRADLRDELHPLPRHAPWEDWYIALRVAAVSEIEYVPAPVLLYRFHGENVVLFGDDDRVLRQWERELPFRRRLLAELDPAVLSEEEVVGAYAAFEQMAEDLGQTTGRCLEEMIVVTEGDRREAARILRRGIEMPPRQAVSALASALALDPTDAAIRRRFVTAAHDSLTAGRESADDSSTGSLDERLTELELIAERS